MTRVVVTTTDPDGWWWGSTGVWTPTGTTLVAVTVPTFVAARAFAVHVLAESQTALAERFASDPYDFDGLAVTCGFDTVPLLSDVPRRLYCHVAHTVPASEAIRVYGIPAAAPLARTA